MYKSWALFTAHELNWSDVTYFKAFDATGSTRSPWTDRPSYAKGVKVGHAQSPVCQRYDLLCTDCYTDTAPN